MQKRDLKLITDTIVSSGDNILECEGHPTLRIKRKFGLRLALALADPFHPYPEELNSALAQPNGMALTIEIATKSKIDVLRFRYLSEVTASSVSKLPAGTRAIDQEACIADLTTHKIPYDVESMVGKNKNWFRLQNRFGAIEFAELSDPMERSESIEKMIAWKREWFSEKGLLATGFNDPFHINCLRTFAIAKNSNCLKVFVLKVGGRIIAVQTYVSSPNGILATVTAGDQEFRQYGPGTLLTRLAISYAASNDLNFVDFLPPSSPHKRSLTNQIKTKIELQIPLSFKGRLALEALDATERLRSRLIN
ncbi:MAG: GNAT family N-acetyltransferase [Pseudomonadota bacterium]